MLRFFYFLKGVRKLRRGEYLAAVRLPMERVTQCYPGGIYVDSSKSAWFTVHRPEVLAELGHRVIVIHIRRPLSDVLASVREGDNKVLMGDKKREKRLRVPRAMFTYFVANAYAYLLRHKFPHLLILQTDLRNHEAATLSRIGEFVFTHFGTNYTRYRDSHVVSGNRLKFTRRPSDDVPTDF